MFTRTYSVGGGTMAAPTNNTKKISSEKNRKCITSKVSIGEWKTFLAISCTLMATTLARDPRCGASFGSFPDPSACDRYVACWDGRGFSQRCGDTMVFNPDTKRCQLGSQCPGLTTGAPSSGELVRLVQGSNPREGRLMIAHNKEWAYVLATDAPPALAALTCQHLGYQNAGGSSSSLVPNSRGPMAMMKMTCPAGSTQLNHCKADRCTDCPANAPIATIRCVEDSASRCPDGGAGRWEAWRGACYLVGREAPHRGGAADACRKAGANLVDINSQSEHSWLSALATHTSDITGYYTAGQLESDLQWRWREQRAPLTYSRWWHGWNASEAGTAAPKPVPAATCLVLRKAFPLETASAAHYDAGFFFYSAEDCLSKKGFICEAPLKNVGCRDGPGFDYSGTASVAESGKACLRWDDPRLNSALQDDRRRQGRSRAPFDVSLLGAHNYCRNPDSSPLPWCYVAPHQPEPCDVPVCQDQRLITQSSRPQPHRRSTPSTFLTPLRSTRSPAPFTPTRVPAPFTPTLPTTRPPSSTITRRSTTSILPTILAMMANKRTVQPSNDKVRCTSNQYECQGGSQCLDTVKLCDGARQCPRGDDERDCKRFLRDYEAFKGHTLLLQLITETVDAHDLAVCAKRCLDLAECKGVIHIPTANSCKLTRIGVASAALQPSTKETFYELRTRKTSCVGRLQCDNKRCVHLTARCDGRDDCGDNSDENNCPRAAQYTLRLVGGTGNHEGNVQLLVKGEWGHVCDDTFGWPEADRICKDLGYKDAVTYTKNNYFAPNRKSAARGGVRFWLDGVSCRGNEDSFFQCHSRAIGRHNCGPTEVAGVVCRSDKASCDESQFQCGVGPVFSCIERPQVCDGVKHCFDGSDELPGLCGDHGVVRLEPSSSIKSHGVEALGTIFVKHRGQWGTVCDDGFDMTHARVVCRSLGYEDGWSIPYARAALGRGKGQVLVDEPLCNGVETSLDTCRGLQWGITDCDHSEDAGVFCSDKETIRLVGGAGPHQGRVEIKLSGVWGTICDDDFDDYDASVICRSIGFPDGGIAHKRARFGAGAGIIWLDALDCTGTEASLRDCIKSAPGTGSCTHMEDAAVTCYTNRRARALDLSAVSSRLPSSCGRQTPSGGALFNQNLAKIVGGRITSPRETPWSVSLMIKEGTKLKHNCGGVIISEDLILTAAHCFKKHPKQNYVIRVGEHDLLANDPGQQDFLIDKLWVHDEFDTNIEFNNDIAVLKVMKKNGRGIILGTGVVEAVCLPSAEVRYSALSGCTITGWGTLSENAPAVPQRLPRSGSVRVYEMSTCTTASGYGTFEVTSGMTCAGRLDGQVDTCTGDSGGPLTCIENGRHVLYGITSWGKGCGRMGQPGMYTKVTKFLRWLNQFAG